MNIGVYLRIYPQKLFSDTYSYGKYMDEISESVLESALKIKDNSNCNITAFTVSDENAEKEMNRIMQFGIENVVCLKSDIILPKIEGKFLNEMMKEYNIDILIIPAFSDALCLTTIAPIAAGNSYHFADDIISYNASDGYAEYKSRMMMNQDLSSKIKFPLIVSYSGYLELRYPDLASRLRKQNPVNYINSEHNVNGYHSKIVFNKNNKNLEITPEDASVKIIEELAKKGGINI